MDARAPIRSSKTFALRWRYRAEPRPALSSVRIAAIGKSDKGTVCDSAHNASESVSDTYVAEGLGVAAPKLLEVEGRSLFNADNKLPIWFISVVVMRCWCAALETMKLSAMVYL